jgi:hypothetical protein
MSARQPWRIRYTPSAISITRSTDCSRRSAMPATPSQTRVGSSTDLASTGDFSLMAAIVSGGSDS